MLGVGAGVSHVFLGGINANIGSGFALATPTLAIASTLGTVPVSFNVSSSDYTASFYGELQIATDSGFSSVAQDIVHTPSGDEWARLDANYGFNDPSGTYYARFRFIRDNEAGPSTITDQLGQTFKADISAWSNTVTDTISVSVAVWASPAGTNASQYITLSGGSLTCTMNNSVNANCGIRATISASGKKHFEFTVVSHGNQTNGSLGIGVVDGTTALGAAVFPKPGGASGVAGGHWRLKSGSTATVVNRNGAEVAGTALSTALADADLVAIEFDTTANTISLFHKPGAGAWYTVQTITLTSQIPSSWYAYGCGFGETGAGTTPPADAWTANFGGSAFSMTPSSGYTYYG